MKTMICFALLFISGVAFSQTGSAIQSRQINSLLERYTALDQFSGSVLVARKGRIILSKGYGMANREWNTLARPSTRFRIASLTKQFTGMLIMQLKQNGIIDLQAPIIRYLPWFPEKTGSRVTIHQLLTHTSGIRNFTDRKDFFSEVSHRDISTRSFIEMYCTDSLEFSPGSKFSYSNSGYYILGAIIEAITDKSFGQVLKEQILDVVGMKNSGIDDPQQIIKERAAGYELPFGVWQNTKFINTHATVGASGNMYSTVEDLYLWDRALYANSLLSEENKKILFTPYLNDYAYGIGAVKFVIGNEKDSVLLTGHTGGINGFRAKILRIIDKEEVVIALSNTSDDHSTADISRITLDILLLLHNQPCPMPTPHIVTETGKRILSGTADDGIRFYKSIRQPSLYDFTDAEGQLEGLGRYLSDHGRQKDCVAVLKFNTEQFPDSAHAFDSYADELEEDNQLQEALINYKKALTLDPTIEHARKALLRLDGEKP
jgi:CubicO group peptidase (beta-lactamase class C family)